MRQTKRLCALMLCLCLALAGCGARAPEAEQAEELDIYATFYPLYAITEMVADGVPDLRLHLLVQPQDGCLRAYSLSDWDAALLGSCDAVLAGGAGLESFAGGLEAISGERFAVGQLFYNMEMMEVEAANADAEAHPHWQGANPHAYMSVDGALEIAGRAAQTLATLDPRYAEQYAANLERAEAELTALRDEIQVETAALAGAKAVVLNEALVYAARDYGLDALYWARESGEAMDEGALEALLQALETGGIRLALIERQAPQRMLEALEGAGIAVAALDVLSTRRAEEGCAAYLDALRSNAEITRAAYETAAQEEE